MRRKIARLSRYSGWFAFTADRIGELGGWSVAGAVVLTTWGVLAAEARGVPVEAIQTVAVVVGVAFIIIGIVARRRERRRVIDEAADAGARRALGALRDAISTHRDRHDTET